MHPLLQQDPPRDDALAREVGHALSGWAGFIAYGALYLLFATMVAVAVMGGYIVAAAAALGSPIPDAAVATVPVIALVAFALTWWPFVRWARRRRGLFVEVARNGHRATASVNRIETTTLNGHPIANVDLYATVDGTSFALKMTAGGRLEDFTEGLPIEVLVDPHRLRAIAFGPGDRITALHWVTPRTAAAAIPPMVGTQIRH